MRSSSKSQREAKQSIWFRANMIEESASLWCAICRRPRAMQSAATAKEQRQSWSALELWWPATVSCAPRGIGGASQLAASCQLLAPPSSTQFSSVQFRAPPMSQSWSFWAAEWGTRTTGLLDEKADEGGKEERRRMKSRQCSMLSLGAASDHHYECHTRQPLALIIGQRHATGAN